MMTTEPVNALLTFLASRNSAAVYIPSVAGAGKVDTAEGSHTQVTVPVQNARLLNKSPTLAKEGFQLVPQDVSAVKDFYDDEQVRSVYHPLVKALLKKHIPGTKRVEIFDDTRRSASNTIRSDRKVREPSANVHNDYTPASAMKRLRLFFETEYPNESVDDDLLQNCSGWCIVNVWRSIHGPVWNYPMVLCNSMTVDEDDVVAVERRSEQRRGEIQMSVYNPNQQWCYFPQMQMDEALLLKTFDSQSNCRTIHSSFDDPTAPADSPPRESIETRCFVFLE